jgi:hypothetical protein
MTNELSFQPLRRNLWTDLEELFGLNGACGGCWCMFWKLRGKAFDEAKGYCHAPDAQIHCGFGHGDRSARLSNGEVVGWVAVEPRSAYEKLAHSRVLKSVDDQEVWSVTCFYVAKKYRSRELLWSC